jgi:hypothetical protein
VSAESPFVPIAGLTDWQRAQEGQEAHRRTEAHVRILEREKQQDDSVRDGDEPALPSYTCVACSEALTSRMSVFVTGAGELCHTRCRVGVKR